MLRLLAPETMPEFVCHDMPPRFVAVYAQFQARMAEGRRQCPEFDIVARTLICLGLMTATDDVFAGVNMADWIEFSARMRQVALAHHNYHPPSDAHITLDTSPMRVAARRCE